jgi:hypothetical protein
MPCCLFNSGQVVATPGALVAMVASGESLLCTCSVRAVPSIPLRSRRTVDQGPIG